MKAAIVEELGASPRYGDFQEPRPDADHVVVDVLASAVHVLVRARAAGLHYSSGSELPFVPGVDAVARTEDGRRIYTGGCPEPFGTLAERAPVARGYAVPVPDELDDAVAAALVNPGASSWAPLSELLGAGPAARGAHAAADGEAQKTVLVHGATGVAGLLALQTSRLLGAGRVIAAGRPGAGLALAGELADAVVDLDADLPAQLASAAPGGVDIVLDYLWGQRAAAILAALTGVGRDPGRPLDFVNIGSVAGERCEVPAAWLRSRPLRMRGSGLGSVTGSAQLAAATGVLGAAARGELALEVDVRPLAEVGEVWDAPGSAGRLVLVP